MERFGTTDIIEASARLKEAVSFDLSNLLETNVECTFNRGQTHRPFNTSGFACLEDQLDMGLIDFEHYNESPDILQVDEEASQMAGLIAINEYSSLLRSNCRVTNQPDWGDIFIWMQGKEVPTQTSLLQYIVSMRKENHFHEEICECVFTRLFDKFLPEELLVGCLYTRRGGIDINPVRATNMKLIDFFFSDIISLSTIVKTARQ